MSRMRFGRFEADPATGELWRDGAAVPIQDLPFRLLVALLERPGELISRAELTTRLWGSETYVDSVAGLNTAVAKLRDALGDDAAAPALIETVPKRGYRFIGTTTAPDAREGHDPRETPKPPRFRFRLALAAALILLVAAAAIVVGVRTPRTPTRVAVALFDNETGRAEFDRLAQGLTDATVFAMTARPQLAVIGNAAVLRTSRPFRDIAAIRDALRADYIVIGQVQMVDGSVIVRTHLIRAADQAHVWVAVTNLTADGERALQSLVAERVDGAVALHATRRRIIG